MFTYSYCGPVFSFDVCIVNKWEATTRAPTESKARSNLVYRYKREHGLTPTAKISLPGNLTQIADSRQVRL